MVAPAFDEEETIETFYERVCSALEGVEFELILVDDGSSDVNSVLAAPIRQ